MMTMIAMVLCVLNLAALAWLGWFVRRAHATEVAAGASFTSRLSRLEVWAAKVSEPTRAHKRARRR